MPFGSNQVAKNDIENFAPEDFQEVTASYRYRETAGPNESTDVNAQFVVIDNVVIGTIPGLGNAGGQLNITANGIIDTTALLPEAVRPAQNIDVVIQLDVNGAYQAGNLRITSGGSVDISPDPATQFTAADTVTFENVGVSYSKASVLP